MAKSGDVTKILITGGSGFIGSNLVPLLSRNAEVRVLDHAPGRSHYDLSKAGAEVVEGDIREPAEMSRAVQGCDAVIHLAAAGSVVDSVARPYENFETNALGTFRVLEAAKDADAKRVILASTGGALIGEADPPVDEESLPKPISPYGASKLCGEAYGFAFHKVYGLDVVTLRFANVYGPWSAHKKGAVTAFIKHLIAGTPFTIYGNGSATRDFLYVGDLCGGIVRALRMPGIAGEVFHLASGVETSIGSLAAMLSCIAGKPDHPVSHVGRREGEVTRNFARYDKAAAVLGYAPQTDLERGLRKTYEWFEAHDDLL